MRIRGLKKRRTIAWPMRVVWIAASESTISNEWFSTRRAARKWADAEERETGVPFQVRAFDLRPPRG